MTEYVKKSDVLELLSLPKDLMSEYVCDLKGLWIDDDEAEQTEPSSSEKPNNCETCKHNKLEWYSEVCDGCSKAHSNYEPKDEPQIEDLQDWKDRMWAEAVIEPQTDCPKTCPSIDICTKDAMDCAWR